jgi:hypothetical protein
MGGLSFLKSKKLNWLWRAIRDARDRTIQGQITKLVERKLGAVDPVTRQLLDEQIDALIAKLRQA